MDQTTYTQHAREKRGSYLTDMLLDLSPFERLLAFILLVIVVVSGTALLYRLDEGARVETPRSGGVHREGIAGTPRFVNPLLAISEADKDLATLVYAGLMTRDAQGTLVPELTQSYSLSEDGRIYTFTLREDLVFHDGTPVTSEDVVFTVELAANAAVKSPVLANWTNVAVEALDTYTLTFTLPEPYMPFLENTTLGILPKHIWNELSPEEFQFSQFNMTPVGAGPYKVEQVVRDRSGIPEQYELSAFEEYALGAPHIATFVFVLYDTLQEAMEEYVSGNLDAVGGISPSYLPMLQEVEGEVDTAVYRTPLLRTFGVFFNHNKQPLFLRDEVRHALDVATPRHALVGEILKGYGTVLESPLPAHTQSVIQSRSTSSVETVSDDSQSTNTADPNSIARAQAILEDAGWTRNEGADVYELETDEETVRLSFALSTVNVPELVAAVELLAERWRSVGAEVDIQVYDQLDLVQSVIRPRRFEALLFGMIHGHELDLYAFWHSSQRNDPGRNVAQYADIETDAILEQLRTEQDLQTRLELYEEFATRVSDQHAAIFLYTPDYIYVVSKNINNVALHPLAGREERFDVVHTWYVDTNELWPFVRDILD